VALLLAVGAVLYTVTPSIGLVTPDTVVTFAALAILLVRPKLLPGLAIGVVAGLLGMAFPNLPSSGSTFRATSAALWPQQRWPSKRVN